MGNPLHRYQNILKYIRRGRPLQRLNAGQTVFLSFWRNVPI